MADVPFELADEIAKLEQKHAETPGGRYFVPLANAYRKVGDFARAEALLHEGLRRHPEYLSAHIVLGRCYADRGAHDSAAEEFRHVLSLDAQNLIALRTLGELAQTRGRADEAAHWYRELLAVDPMNDEARAALEALAAQEASLAGPGPREAAEEPAADAPAGEPLLQVVEEEEEWSAGLDAADAGRFEPGSPLDEPLGAELEAAFGGWEPSDDVDAFYLAPVDLDSPAPAPADAAPGADATSDADLFDFGGADVVLDLPQLAVDEEDGDEDGGPREPTVGEGHAAGVEEAEAPADTPEDDFGEDAGEVVTRTIAELYARQGLYGRAASVYGELIRRAGGRDAELEARLAEVERLAREEAEGATAAVATWGADEEEAPVEPLDRPRGEAADAAPPAAEADAPAEDAFAASFAYGFAGAPAAPAGAGMAATPIAAYLAELLAWTPPAMPAEPAGDASAEPLPWELPTSDADAPADAAAEEEEFSFDAFFGDAPAAPPAADELLAASEAAAADGGVDADADDDEAEDLESFQAWLRSLKR